MVQAASNVVEPEVQRTAELYLVFAVLMPMPLLLYVNVYRWMPPVVVLSSFTRRMIVLVSKDFPLMLFSLFWTQSLLSSKELSRLTGVCRVYIIDHSARCKCTGSST